MSIVEPLSLRHGALSLRGSRYPAGARRVLLCHGFKSNRMGPGRFYVELARALQEAGLTVESWDRAGQGESDGALSDLTLEDELQQLERMIDACGGKGVHLVGHSLGAMEAAALAGRVPGKVAGLTLLAPAAAVHDEVCGGTVLGRPVSEIERSGYVDLGGQIIDQTFIDSARAFDPYAGLRAFDGPVTVHHCRDDAVVPYRYSERYAEIWPQARLHLHDSGGHGFEEAPLRAGIISDIVTRLG